MSMKPRDPGLRIRANAARNAIRQGDLDAALATIPRRLAHPTRATHPRTDQAITTRTLKACTICGIPCEGPRCNKHGGNRRAMTTTQRGYGAAHQRKRALLHANAIGNPCPICHDTMHHNQPLDLDHTTPLSTDPTSQGDRIVHSSCNRAHGASISNGGVGKSQRPQTLDPASFRVRREVS